MTPEEMAALRDKLVEALRKAGNFEGRSDPGDEPNELWAEVDGVDIVLTIDLM